MKKAIFTLIICAAASVAVAENIQLGPYSLWNQYDCDRIISLGMSSAYSLYGTQESIFIGSTAGAQSHEQNGVIAIGNGAMSGTHHCNGTVAIGTGELAGMEYNNNTTSINGEQLWISQPARAFCINPVKNADFTNAPLYYKDGELHLNAKKILNANGAAINGGSSGSFPTYDLYLSPFGDDGNSGRSALEPKKTMWGCFLAATNDFESVCVFSGEYEPPSAEEKPLPNHPSSKGCFILPAHPLNFIAVEGKENTFIVGHPTNDNYATLAFWQGYNYFKGFTVIGLHTQVETHNTRSNKSRPILTLCDFEDCDFDLCEHGYSLGYAGIIQCNFTNCRFLRNRFFDWMDGGNHAGFFRYCNLNKTVITSDTDFSVNTNGSRSIWTIIFDDECKSRNCFFDFATAIPHQNERTSGAYSWFYDCTFVSPLASDGTFNRAARAYCTNCYFVVTNSLTGGTDNIFVNRDEAYIDSNGVPNDIRCQAIRTDGRDDCGWKNSGLALKKVVSQRADIRFEEGVLAVYTNGVKAATVEVTPVPPPEPEPEPVVQNSLNSLEPPEESEDGLPELPAPRTRPRSP